jgi:hypothetical protein
MSTIGIRILGGTIIQPIEKNQNFIEIKFDRLNLIK